MFLNCILLRPPLTDDGYRCARLHTSRVHTSCVCQDVLRYIKLSFYCHFRTQLKRDLKRMSDIMNSTFCIPEESLTFGEFLDQQSFDDETPTNSTHNKFNFPLSFEQYLNACPAIVSFNTSPCTTDSSDSSFYYSRISNSTLSFTNYLKKPMTTRFFIRYDDPSFYHFCDSQHYLHIYGFGPYCH